MASSNNNSVYRSNTIDNSMELVVLGRAKFLMFDIPERTKEDCVNQAITELAERYIEDTARIFDILIDEAREDFKKNYIKTIVNNCIL